MTPLYDNALAESFVATPKAQATGQKVLATREEVRTAIFEFAEVFYNRQRIHPAMGYRSPVDYERSTLGEGVAA